MQGGELTLTGANTYTGGTTIDAGTLEAAGTASLPGYAIAGKITAGSGGVLALSVGGSGWTSASIAALLSSNSSHFAAGRPSASYHRRRFLTARISPVPWD